MERRDGTITSMARLLIITFAVLLTCCELKDEDANTLIQKSESLRRLHEICSQIPRPPVFKLSEKRLSGNAVTSLIIYRYDSDMPFAEVYETFSRWFEQNGWNFDGPIDTNVLMDTRYFQFHKDGTTVSIEKVPFPNADYSLSCSRGKYQ